MNYYDLPNMGGPTRSARLIKILISELRHGEYSSHNKLPSEIDLATRFNVSRTVIRDVMSYLEQEGFVKRVRGMGTVINREIVNIKSRLDLKYEYYELINNIGYHPTTDNVRLHEKPVDEDMAEKIGLDPGEPVIICEKRILASGKPAIYSINTLPKKLFSATNYESLNWGQPIFDLLEEFSSIVVDTSISKVSASNCPTYIRQQLELGENEAAILLDEIGYYKLSQPVLHTYGFYNNFFDFVLLRKKL